MVDVLLVNPPTPRKQRQSMEHLGLGHLASMLRENGFSVDIINAQTEGLDFEALANELSIRSFDVLGISVLFQNNLKLTLEWLKLMTSNGLNTHITIGGHPATFTYEEILAEYECINSVVRGEGEYTLVELVKKVKAGTDWRSVDGIAFRDGNRVVLNAARDLIADLNVLPWPARDAFEAHPGAFDQIVVAGSRGCHCQCSFCSIATFYRSFKGRVWRRRDLDDVFDEIDAVRKISPIKFVLMIDDTFIGPGKIGREQAFEFAEALGRRRTDYFVGTSCRADQVDEELFKELKKAGVRLVFLGIESGNEETLKLYDKRSSVEANRKALEILNKLNICVEAGFIMFNPYTKFANVREDLDFLLETGLGPETLSDLGLFPGEPIIEKLKKDDLLTGSPFDYVAKYNDPGVGEFFEFIRMRLFRQVDLPAVGKGEQVLQAVKLGMLPPTTPKVQELESALREFYGVVYGILHKGADMFEGRFHTEKNMLSMQKEFQDQCAEHSAKLQKLIEQTELNMNTKEPV